MGVQALLQPWLLSGLATGCLAKQVLLPASAQLNAQLSRQQSACFQAVQAHLSTSTCASGRPQYDSSWSSSSERQTYPCTPAASSTFMAHQQASPTPAASWQSTGAQRRSVSTTAAVAAIGARTKQERMLMEQDFKLNVYGRVMEQYKHPVSYLESGAFPSFTRTKKYIRDRFGLWLHNYQADKTAKANILGFTEAALCEEVARMYLEVQGAQAVMQADLARDVVSKSIYLKLKSQADQRARQGWATIKWECVDADNLHKNVHLVQRRSYKFWQDSPFDWLQFTFRINSKQRFAAYSKDAKGQEVLVSGDPNQVLDVTEYCVFERKTKSKVKRSAGSMFSVGLNSQDSLHLEGSRWRLVAWINPDVAEEEDE